MTTWAEFRREAPAFAEYVQGRFEQHGVALLATLRRDGSPRISGLEPRRRASRARPRLSAHRVALVPACPPIASRSTTTVSQSDSPSQRLPVDGPARVRGGTAAARWRPALRHAAD